MLLTITCSGKVLDLFTAEEPEWGVTEVTRELGFSKSKAHALLSSLADVGLLRRTEAGRYRLGWRLLGMNQVLAQTTEFHQLALPTMRALQAHLEETIHLGTLDGGDVVYVNRLQSPNSPAPAVSTVGSVMPAYCTAIGKVLLAYLGEDELHAVLQSLVLESRTERTIATRDGLIKELEITRKRGFALDNQESLPGVACAAAPVVNPETGRAIAALSITAPAERFATKQELYHRAITRAGQFVSRQMREAHDLAAGAFV